MIHRPPPLPATREPATARLRAGKGTQGALQPGAGTQPHPITATATALEESAAEAAPFNAAAWHPLRLLPPTHAERAMSPAWVPVARCEATPRAP